MASLHTKSLPTLHANARVVVLTQQCLQIEVALLVRASPVENKRHDATNQALEGDHVFGANACSRDVHLSISQPLHGRTQFPTPLV